MSISMYVGRHNVDLKVFKFPAGESGLQIQDRALGYNTVNPAINITMNWESNDDLINLALAVDAARREYPGLEIALTIPYFPYARQDRVCNKGESHSLKVVCNFVNSLNAERVYVTDPHSDVVGALLNNVHICTVESKILKAMQDCNATVIVSPDAGALKKIQKYAQFVSTYIPEVEVVRADKTRDVRDGKITDTIVNCFDLGATNVLVVDDICDGGGTFIPLADKLKGKTSGTINLFLSHGIFTKGVDIVAEQYDNIYVVNNMFGPNSKIKEV